MASALAVGAWGCAAVPQAGEGGASHLQPLDVTPGTYDFSRNPKLLSRILASPHGYFRFINVAFSREVCRRFQDRIGGVPVVNLHGDAHLEQYAVTDLGRGLTDFDDSSQGPAILDLLRFGVSLNLACAERGWSADATGLFDHFLEGYRAALEDPTLEVPEPSFPAAVRATFHFDRGRYFEWVSSVMDPVASEERAGLEAAMAPYVESMRAESPDLPPGFFDVVELGRLRMGIGSALDRKYLVRVRGRSDGPDDDAVLEVKEVRDLAGISCIQAASGGDAFRILVGQSRIAYKPYEYLGYIRFEGRVFWIHSWVDNYREVEIAQSIDDVDSLREIVYDIGVQLGRGHPNQIAAPLDAQLRRAQLRMLDRERDELLGAQRTLTTEVVQSWERFRSAMENHGGRASSTGDR